MEESYVVNKSTGELTCELHKGDKILRDKTTEYLNNTDEWKLKNFYKGNSDELNLLIPELSDRENLFLLRMAQYVGYEDNCLKFGNGQELQIDNFIKITGFGRSTVFKVLNRLEKKDIIYKGSNSKGTQYFINPWLFCKGNRINKVLKTMFKNYRIRSKDNVRWKDLK